MFVRVALLIAVLWAALSPILGRASPCDVAARTAEQAFALPPNLLAAIGRVETGRVEGATIAAWPWSVNAAGRGYFLASAEQAIALVTTLRAQGVQSIDVGCFQVNLLYHPESFASLPEAFDPTANALAAARFLSALHGLSPDWEDAVARYHSANPVLGLPYMRQVMASWAGGPAMARPPISQVAALVRVIVPGMAASGPAGGGVRLPVVFTPSRVRL